MNDLIAEGAVVVQNATILSDVTVDHSNVSVASVNCNQSIITHDKVDGWNGHVDESELVDGVARSELVDGMARSELVDGMARSELVDGMARSELANGPEAGGIVNDITTNTLVNEHTDNGLINTPSAASLISSDSLASSSIPVLPTPIQTTLPSTSLITEVITPTGQEDSRPVNYWMPFSPVS